MPLTPARLSFTADQVPYSATFGDVYHSASGGPAQARHVFLAGNDLPARWRDRERFVILETGFGLGLNFLATWSAWRDDPAACRRLHFVSIEKHPFTAGDLAIAHRAWPEFAPLAEELQAQWPPLVPGVHRLNLAGGRVILTLVFGDAVEELRQLDLKADAFYLDGFSPAKNPDLWSPPVFKAIARLAAPGATLATWSVAAGVREALAAVEFDLEKRPGFAGKREMLVGHYRSRRPTTHQLPTDRRAIVIGAGAAGATTAHRLAARGWRVTVLEAGPSPGHGASGNIAGMFRPLPSSDDNRLSRLTRAGFLATRQLLLSLGDRVRWEACGVLHLARDPEHEAKQRLAVDKLGFPPDFLQFLEPPAASTRLGWPVDIGGWWFPSGGWVQPPSYCAAALADQADHIDLRLNCPVSAIEPWAGGWRALGNTGEVVAEAPILVMASGVAAPGFQQLAWLPQIIARGQVTHIPEAATPPLTTVVCRQGYATPAVDGRRVAGASNLYGDNDPAERLAEHQDNLAKLNLVLPGFAPDLDATRLQGRVGFRPVSPDRLPMVGPVPRAAAPLGSNARWHNLPRQPGLWCVQGFGARGIVWSGLMAELLASRIDGDPLPLTNDLVEALDPGRFLLKAAHRGPHNDTGDEA